MKLIAWLAPAWAAEAFSPPTAWAHVIGGSDFLLLLIFIASLVHTTYYLFLDIANPLLDYHAFRQTQTALSAYWMWRGGP